MRRSLFDMINSWAHVDTTSQWNSKPAIHVAIIHHPDQLRLRHMKQLADALAEVAGRESLGLTTRWYSWQPEHNSHATRSSVSMVHACVRSYARLKWTRFVQRDSQKLFTFLAAQARAIRGPAYAPRQAWIEAFLSAKHSRAWADFLEGSSDVLLVIENDAVWAGRESDLKDLLEQCLRVGQLRQPAYVDVAGGLEIARLGVSHLVSESDLSSVRFRRPVTNTTCSYLMNRSLAEALLTSAIRLPWIRLLPSDWMINMGFCHMAHRGVAVECTHLVRRPLAHGSVCGEYPSAIRESGG